MARIRSIKPDLFLDDGLSEVSLEAHFLLAGLPCLADSEGRLEDRPRRIQAQIFPYRPQVDVDRCLGELVRSGHIRRYEVNGSRYLQVENWAQDQRPHVKEAPSVIPSPADYTGHRKGSELAGNSPGTRRDKSAGILDLGSGVLDPGSGDSSPPSSARQESFLPESKATPRKKAEKPTDPRHAPLVKALVEQGWELGGGRGAKAVELLLARGTEATSRDGASQEVLRRAGYAREKLQGRDAGLFPSVAELGELVTHWGHFATGPPGKREAREDPNAGIMQAAPNACAGCGKQGQGGMVGEPEIWLGYECGCLPEFTEAQSQGLHFTMAAEWARKRRAA